MRMSRMFLFTFGVLLGMVSQPVMAQPLDILWVRRHEYNLRADIPTRVGVDAEGNVYVVGYGAVPATQIITPQLILLKYDAQGQPVWTRYYARAGEQAGIPAELIVRPSGTFYVMLRQEWNGDYVVQKYDRDGNLLWTQTYDGTEGTFWGGNDIARAFAVDDAGNVYVTGSSEGYWTGPDIATVKYDANGRGVWVRRYSTSVGSLDREGGTALVVSPSGDVYVAASAFRGWSQVKWVILKYDARGRQLWVQEEEHPSQGGVTDASQPRAALLDTEGNLYVVGEVGERCVVVKYSPSGNRLWRLDYAISNHDLACVGAQSDTLGNVYVAAEASAGYPYYVWLAVAFKVSPTGQLQWDNRIMWGNPQTVKAAALDANGNFWLAGSRPMMWAGDANCILWRFSSDGVLQQELEYDASPTLLDIPVDVTPAQDGIVVAATSGLSPDARGAMDDILVLKCGLPDGFTLRGRILLGDVAISIAGVPVEADLRQNGHIVRRDTVYVDANGNFTLYNAPEGVYDIAFRGMHWLRRVVPQVTIAPGAPEVEVYLVNGDIDGDNEVTLFDFGLLVQAFGSNPYDANWNINADLDMDAEVTLFDFAVIVFNFGEIGDD